MYAYLHYFLLDIDLSNRFDQTPAGCMLPNLHMMKWRFFLLALGGNFLFFLSSPEGRFEKLTCVSQLSTATRGVGWGDGVPSIIDAPP